MTARRARLELIYDGVNISADIAPDLISFEFNDNESNEVDDISIKLKNDHGRWTGAWFPGKGDTIRATIITGSSTLYCGTFKIDDLSASFKPSELDIKAVSVPIDENIRRTKKNRTLEDVKLSTIVEDVAESAGLAVIYDVKKDPFYSRISQREESDLKFIARLAEDEGYSVKVTNNQLVVFDQLEYESKAAIATIEVGVDDVISCNLKSQAFDLYKTCKVMYYDPEKEDYVEQVFTAPNIESGMEDVLNRRADSLAEAKRLAKARLRKLNSHEITGEITVVGDTSLIAGVTINLLGVGRYSGKYMIEKARHSVGSGYTTTLTIRHVLEDY